MLKYDSERRCFMKLKELTIKYKLLLAVLTVFVLASHVICCAIWGDEKFFYNILLHVFSGLFTASLLALSFFSGIVRRSLHVFVCIFSLEFIILILTVILESDILYKLSVYLIGLPFYLPVNWLNQFDGAGTFIMNLVYIFGVYVVYSAMIIANRIGARVIPKKLAQLSVEAEK